MPSPITVAVDAMGGDHAPAAVVRGAVDALQEADCSLILVGDETTIRDILSDRKFDNGRLEIVDTDEVVGMQEPATTPIRQKRRSSVRLCADLVHQGRAHGMVSAGNTGAAMIVAKMVIGTIEGVDRPALSMLVPNPKGSTLVLDVGANVDSKAEYLRQFAVLGHSYAQEILGTSSPRVGLLSIGEEEGKGTDLTREVFKIMESGSLNFVGNVEGRDVFAGTVDVIICDGFVGNVLLKSCESLVELMAHLVNEEIQKSWISRLGYFLARPAFARLRRCVDSTEYGAAQLLGIKGACFIGHGNSNAKAIKNSVLKATEFCQADLHLKMREKIAELHRFEVQLLLPPETD